MCNFGFSFLLLISTWFWFLSLLEDAFSSPPRGASPVPESTLTADLLSGECFAKVRPSELFQEGHGVGAGAYVGNDDPKPYRFALCVLKLRIYLREDSHSADHCQLVRVVNNFKYKVGKEKILFPIETSVLKSPLSFAFLNR